jgi:hypothetical protein
MWVILGVGFSAFRPWNREKIVITNTIDRQMERTKRAILVFISDLPFNQVFAWMPPVYSPQIILYSEAAHARG